MDKVSLLLDRGVEKVLPNKEGLAKLMRKKKVRVYHGIDPTATKLHLGHTVGLRKLMEFADAGHEAILLFGTGTVLVGDPSERETGRKLITQEEIEHNITTWKDQVKALVDFDKIKILQNGDWLTKLTVGDIVNIASKISAIQLFKRNSFQKRLKKGNTVWYHETMYPLFQGYDSVVMDVDLEIGGTDQEFNMLIGRELQKKINNREKYVLTYPMIMGTDGRQMSKTSGNCVWLNDPPDDIFAKLMRIPDSQIESYLSSVTNIKSERVKDIIRGLNEGSVQEVDAKKELAFSVIEELHDKSRAQNAQKHFEETFQKGNFPQDAKLIIINHDSLLFDLVSHETGSNSKAKRLFSQHAVSVDGKNVSDPKYILKSDQEIKIGKKIFIRTKLK